MLIVTCASPSTTATPSPTHGAPTSERIAPGNARAFSLLANNHLLVADIESGAVLAELTLAGPASPISEVHALAFTNDNLTLFALVSEASGRSVVAAVDAATYKVAATFDPGGGLAYRGLAVGPRTGRLYLFGNQGGDAVVRVLDPSGKQATQTWPARASGGRNWLIYQGAVASDESALYLSYHGPDTTGVDRFAIQASGLMRCEIASLPDSGCFRTHGAFALRGGILIAAAGESPVMELDSVTGLVRGQYDLHLVGNHLMEFGIAVDVDRLYAVGSCGYSGGLAVADLPTHQTQILAPPRTRDVICGERIAALGNGTILVVLRTAAPVPSLLPGALVVLTSDGSTLRTIKTSAEPIDLLLF